MSHNGLAMFPEDIQIEPCALQASIWESVEKTRDRAVDASTLSTIRALLVQQLEYWKSKLAAFNFYDAEEPHTPLSSRSPTATRSAFPPQTTTGHIEAGVSSQNYHGLERHDTPGWQQVVLNRPRSLVFDTTMLYHLLSIHIHTKVRNLCRLSSYQNQVTTELRLRRLSAATWAMSSSAVEALRHSGQILELYQRDGYAFEGVATEPVTLMALFVGALVVWSWPEFSGAACNGVYQSQRGGMNSVWIDGVALCICSKEEIISRFRSYVPGGDTGWVEHLSKFAGP